MLKDQYTFSILIMPYEEGYMAMCRETGLIRQGETLEEAQEALHSAMVTLIKTVKENEKLEPSLSVGLPFKYKILFHWTLFKWILAISFKIFFQSAVDRLSLRRDSLQDFQTAC